MKDWYLRQTPRDRIIVICVSVLCLLGLLYAFVWFPITSGLDQNRTLINTKRETLQQMEVASAKIKSMGSNTGVIKSSGDKAPYTLIDERIRAASLANKPDRVEPRGSDGTAARVQFSTVEFDKLIQVIADLETYGLSIDTLNVSRKNDAQGMVSARFVMEKN